MDVDTKRMNRNVDENERRKVGSVRKYASMKQFHVAQGHFE
jgi:hypothetical protein